MVGTLTLPRCISLSVTCIPVTLCCLLYLTLNLSGILGLSTVNIILWLRVSIRTTSTGARGGAGAECTPTSCRPGRAATLTLTACLAEQVASPSTGRCLHASVVWTGCGQLSGHLRVRARPGDKQTSTLALLST